MTQRGARRQKLVLVFGEDETDRGAVKELIFGLRPNFSGKIKTVRQPPVYSKDINRKSARSHVRRMCGVIAAEQATADVVAVFVHRDCDAPEPAHHQQSAELQGEFGACGYSVLAVTPAWELESWLFLWPDAVAPHRPSWNRVHRYSGQHVGLIPNAKEEFRRAVRSPGMKGRDYRPSDAPAIAEQARRLGIVGSPRARSDSFACFRRAVVQAVPDT